LVFGTRKELIHTLTQRIGKTNNGKEEGKREERGVTVGETEEG